MIRLVIAEDEKQIRDGLLYTIPWKDMHYEVVGAASNGEDAADMLNKLKPAVLLTDIRMPKKDGITLLKEAREQFPQLKVIILSGYDDFEYARSALKHGASDYLLKPVGEQELAATLAKIREALLAEEKAALSQFLPEQIVARLPGVTPLVPHQDANVGFIRRIEKYVESNYMKNISVVDAASEAGLSPNYFSNLFKKCYGLSFVGYLNGIRIAKACELIAEGKFKIYEIAEKTGFTDYKYFSTVFRKITGKSPSRIMILNKHKELL
ncbi:MAG: response regulator [Treponema sp.]|jgi:two-component system response regulator YesN|nr:response regulator [Treponema sp.]